MNQHEIRCIACKHETIPFSIMNLGNPYLNDYVDDVDCKVPRFPLHVVMCSECRLMQLDSLLPQDVSFRNYWYRSGITQTMRSRLKHIVDTASDMVGGVREGEHVVDIGANDGTLLRNYAPEVIRYGFEPARNLAEEAKQGGNFIVSDYFYRPELNFPVLRSKVKVVTAISMFYDVPDPLEFLNSVHAILRQDGVFVLQMNYAKAMIDYNAFDNIGHEHVAYYTFAALNRLLVKANLQAFKVEENDTNGGSICVYIKKKIDSPFQRTRNAKTEVDYSVNALMKLESEMNLDSPVLWTNMAQQIDKVGFNLVRFLHKRKAENKRIYLLGASTRVSTLLQYFVIDNNLLEGASERDERKFGKITSGSNLKILPEHFARPHADCFLVGPWHFKDEIIEREKDFIAAGGELIFPMPTPVSVTKGAVTSLMS